MKPQGSILHDPVTYRYSQSEQEDSAKSPACSMGSNQDSVCSYRGQEMTQVLRRKTCQFLSS